MKELIRAAEGVRKANTMPEEEQMDLGTFLELSERFPDAHNR